MLIRWYLLFVRLDNRELKELLCTSGVFLFIETGIKVVSKEFSGHGVI